MLHVTQLRGAQSGGGAVKVGVAGQPRQIIDKCVKAKRADLADPLDAADADGPAAAGGRARRSWCRRTCASRPRARPARGVASVSLRRAGAARPAARVSPGVLEAAPTRAARSRPRSPTTAISTRSTFRGVRIAHPELGFFLERVLEAENRWVGDSPALAGAFELFLTQGLWLESLRLAYLEVIAPPPPDISVLAAAQRPRRHARLRAPAPARVPGASRGAARRARRDRRAGLARRPSPRRARACRSATRWPSGSAPRCAPIRCATSIRGWSTAFARRALDRFLDNDLFRAAREMEARGRGHVRLRDHQHARAGHRGGVRARAAALAGRAARDRHGRHRLRAQRAARARRRRPGRVRRAARLRSDQRRDRAHRDRRVLQPQLALYSVAERRTLHARGARTFGAAGLAARQPADPAAAARGQVARAPGSRGPAGRPARGPRRLRRPQTRATAAAPRRWPTRCSRTRRRACCVLGITNDLWLAQQFVSNLKLCLRGVHAEAMSSNQFLKESVRRA